jgi:hypothetical protein
LARFGQRAFQLFRVLKGRSIALQAVDQQDASPDLVAIVSRHVPDRVDDVLHDAAVPVAVPRLLCNPHRRKPLRDVSPVSD